MFKRGLLATTALIFVASVSRVAAQPGAASGSRMQTFAASRDANTEFLCNYGYFEVSAEYTSIYGPTLHSGSNYSSAWTYVAVPIVGHGQTVDRITVEENEGASTYSSDFHIGIYSSNRKGFPGYQIVGGTGKAPGRCGRVTIQVTPTLLERAKTYWVEERVSTLYYKNEALWAINPKTKLRAYVQHHSCFSCHTPNHHSHTSRWTMQSMGPYVKLR